MTRQSTDTCASCAKFDIDGAAKNGGVGWCSGYEKNVVLADKSVLHMPARDIARRTPLVKQLRAQQPEGEK